MRCQLAAGRPRCKNQAFCGAQPSRSRINRAAMMNERSPAERELRAITWISAAAFLVGIVALAFAAWGIWR